MTIEELTDKLPGIGHLISEYKLSTDIAFFLTRPFFTNLYMNKFEEYKKKKTDKEEITQLFCTAYRDILSPWQDLIRDKYDERVWDEMEPGFFLMFWLLSMSDLEIPTKAYDKEIKKVTDNLGSKLRKRETDRLTNLKEKLEEEKKKQTEHVERVSALLSQDKGIWFTQKTTRSLSSVVSFLQNCIFPRCTFSTPDAIYCARFVKLLHHLKTPNFSTLLCYDKMYCDITYTVTCILFRKV